VNPKYPIYIVSKSRWESSLTSNFLNEILVPHYIIVEESQYNQYKKYVSDKNKYSKLLILPKSYLNDYDTCDDLGFLKSKGPGSARNFAWDHSINMDFEYHWVMDDNIRWFGRLNKNITIPVADGTILKCAEDFATRYENVGMSGFNYYKFVKNTDRVPPYVLNTRIYSCNFIKNDIDFRWRGRYNEDTDLSLRILKKGLCTLQFNAFLQEKITTQRIKGGNTEEFYSKEGTYNKSKMLEDLHPDVARVVWKFNRWHHQVDYRPFKNNKLIRKKNFNFKKITNNYNMKIIEV